MKNKAVSGLMLTLLLTSMSTFASSLQPIEAEPTTIVVPDDYAKIQWAIGNATTGDTIFVRAGTYYEHLYIDKSLSLIGENRSTTIIDGYATGTVITIPASNVMVSQFTIQNSGPTAHGVGIFFSNHNMLINNTVRGNGEGIHLYETSDNTLRNNNVTGNLYNFGVRGVSLLHFIHDIDISNTVNGKPVYYLANQGNMVINSSTFPDAGYLGLVNSTHITVKNLNLTSNHQGVLFAYTTNSTLLNVNVTNNRYGFYLVHCANDVINGNVINSNYWDGIYLRSCSNITITGNSLANNRVGITLEYFGDNIISGNNLQNNAYTGIFVSLSSSNIFDENIVTMTFPFEDYGHGIWLKTSNNNLVKNNTIVSNRWQAIILQDSATNDIFCNTVTSNGVGIYLDSANGNLIYHNDFVDNTVQANSANSVNNWDDGYPSGGNYWSDYSTRYPSVLDEYNGENQDILGSDGIWDSPYGIDVENQDNYPLVNPLTPTPTVVTATLDVAPDTLNLRSVDEWITCFVELPESYDVSDIDVSTVMLNDTIPVSLLDVPAPEPVPIEIGDSDNDTIPDLMVKFDRAMVSASILSKGITYGNVTLTIAGELFDGTPFEGSDSIRVVLPSSGCGGCKGFKK
jgi:parallel beta-helix repeat protein